MSVKAIRRKGEAERASESYSAYQPHADFGRCLDSLSQFLRNMRKVAFAQP